MKVIKEKISLLEAKALQSFLSSHKIAAHLTNEHGLDSLLGPIVYVSVDDEDYLQALRLLKDLDQSSDSDPKD